MSDFKAKMHQIQFRLGLRPRPRWGSFYLLTAYMYQIRFRPGSAPDPLAGFEGPTSKGGEKGRGSEGREGGEGRG